MIAALLVFFTGALPLLIMGIFIRRGRGFMLISGYNMLPKEAKDRVDKAALAKHAGNMLLRMAAELTIMAIAIFLGLNVIAFVFIMILMADAFISSMLMYKFFPKTRMSTWSKRILGAVAILMIIGPPALFYFGEREPTITLYEYSIRIDGMYGTTIALNSINEITLLDQSMAEIGPGVRRNGFGGLTGTLKGHFDAGLLFVNTNNAPTIQLVRFPQNVYISFRDSALTRSVYEILREVID